MNSPAAATRARPLDDAEAIRRAGPDLLSLALIDARNALLALLAHDESPRALRLAARAGHDQEYWIARHVQRQRGEACDPAAPRLAGIEPRSAAWCAEDGEPAGAEELRGYLSLADGPGWALIACRTVPDFKVDDCVGLDEYPTGSNIQRAVLAAAWQFKVRPPRVGGISRVGDWVRIRIDYEERRR